MFPLGHVGITLGFIYLLQQKSKGTQIDYRIIIVMAMLPDIIDKFTGHIILRNTINNGRLIAHTPLFAICGTLIIRHIRKQTDAWPFYSIPLWTHLILDRVWEDHHLLFWPFLGWQFKSHDWNIIETWMDMVFSHPYTLVGEVMGGSILLFFFLKRNLYTRKGLIGFLKTGSL